MTDHDKNRSAGEAMKTPEVHDEPSMEDILTSIRRILSEEGSEDTATPEQEEAMAREQSPESQPDMGIDFTEIESDDQPGDMAPAGPAPAAAGRAKPMDDNILLLTPEMRAPAGDPVMSSATAEASADALTQLARAILDHRDINIGTREVTLETMVRQMLRPLLKEWLDRNLPYLIERLVKKEIDLMINRAERL